VALLTMHHIVSDGWSMGVLVKEVAALYEAFSAGQDSPLPELEIQYADYATWQRSWLQGAVLEQQLGYWKEQLAGVPALLELPVDRPRPAVQSYRGRSEMFVLGAELTGRLKELSRKEGTTLFMTLLAAFQTLLQRYSGQDDIVVGTAMAGRHRFETEGLIGFFNNTLVLRARLDQVETFRDLLRQVREVTLGAYAHQDLPFDKLVEELQPERSLSHMPLFQVSFTLENVPMGELELPGLSLSPVAQEHDTVQYDLNLNLREMDGVIAGAAQYCSDLFDVTTIQRLVQNYTVLLETIAGAPGMAITSLNDVLDDAEHRRRAETITRLEQLSINRLTGARRKSVVNLQLTNQ